MDIINQNIAIKFISSEAQNNVTQNTAQTGDFFLFILLSLICLALGSIFFYLYKKQNLKSTNHIIKSNTVTILSSNKVYLYISIFGILLTILFSVMSFSNIGYADNNNMQNINNLSNNLASQEQITINAIVDDKDQTITIEDTKILNNLNIPYTYKFTKLNITTNNFISELLESNFLISAENQKIYKGHPDGSIFEVSDTTKPIEAQSEQTINFIISNINIETAKQLIGQNVFDFNIQLYPQTYILNFNATLGAFGDGAKIKDVEQTIGAQYILPENPTLNGYIFDGWYTQEKGQGEKIDDTMIVKNTNITNLYANWTIDTFRITAKNDNTNVSVFLTNIENDIQPNLQYKLEADKDYKNIEFLKEEQTPIATINAGESIYFIGDNNSGFSFWTDEYENTDYYTSFIVDNEYEVNGNIMSLLNQNGDIQQIPPESVGCFYGLFDSFDITYEDSMLVKGPDLPAQTLAKSCYEAMFKNCTNMIYPPNIYANKLSEKCYYRMFEGCNSLIETPNLAVKDLCDNCYFSMFKDCKSLTYATELPAESLAIRCYYAMFRGCTNLCEAPQLPAMQLADMCYSYMFYGCSSLEKTPQLLADKLYSKCYQNMFTQCASLINAGELPATNLAESCYELMYSECENLVNAPYILPANILSENCYREMFEKCTNLSIAPLLPATNLAKNCYYYMFNGCSNLAVAPKLDAENLAEACYYGMFMECINLKEAPVLNAKSLANNCYRAMFQGCNNLQYIEVSFNSWDELYTGNWVLDVSETGKFKCPADLEQKFGISYIPEGWQIINTSN